MKTRVRKGENTKQEKWHLSLSFYRNDGSHESSNPEGRIFSMTPKRRAKEMADTRDGWRTTDRGWQKEEKKKG